MASTTSQLGTVTIGSTLVAIGDFIGNGYSDLLWEADGSYTLWAMSASGVSAEVPLTLPSNYQVIGASDEGAAKPGTTDLFLESTNAGTVSLYYGLLSQCQTGYSVAISSDGTLPSGAAVVATGDYNNINYLGPSQVLLETAQDNIGTLKAFNSNAYSAFDIPAGFTVVSNVAGHFFGTDLPETLVFNAQGTVQAIMDGETVYARPMVAGKATSLTIGVAVTNTIGTLGLGESIVAVGSLNADGSTDILLQQSGTLYEWVVSQGVIQQTLTIGALPPGETVVGLADMNRDSASDILLMDNTGSVDVIDGKPTFAVNTTLLNTATPVIALAGDYDILTNGVTTVAGSSATLSDYLAELTTGVGLSSVGAKILTIAQGALSMCSFEQVAQGNITLAAWQQNVATLNAIAQYCRVNGITVQIETQLGWEGFGAAQTDQWLDPALAAGLPIGYVEDDQEIGTATIPLVTTGATTAQDVSIYNLTSAELAIPANIAEINQYISIAATNELADIAIIHAALPNAVFGEWDITGDADTGGTITPYHAFLQDWYSAIGGLAAAQGLPGISFVIADQYYSPNLSGGVTVSETGQGAFYAGSDTAANVASLIQDARNAGISAVEIQDYDTDLSALGSLARKELEIAQEATLGIAGIEFGGGEGHQPVSQAVDLPGSTFNGLAEAAAIEPLYQNDQITTKGSVALTLPNQIVLGQGMAKAVGGVSVSAAPADSNNDLAVVLIDQTGSLWAAQPTGPLAASVSISNNGANELIIDGTPAGVAAALAGLTISEAVAGPDSIDVEVFGSSGRVAGGTIAVLATNSNGSTNYTPSAAGVLPQLWDSASATVNNGIIVNEGYVWNNSDGLSADDFVGGTTIAPIMQVLVDQPLMEQGLTVASCTTFAALPAGDLDWSAGWDVYDPLAPGLGNPSTSEAAPVTVASSALEFDPAGKLATEIDTLASVPQSAYSGVFPSALGSYYFANGGTVVTQYNTGANPNWPTSAGSLYDSGGPVAVISAGPTLEIADGSTTPMVVGSIQTIYGMVDGAARVVEVRYLGGPTNPYDELDQIFNPNSATPQLWQQINTVGIPTSMAGSSPLPIPSATTVTEYNTGNNPDWNNEYLVSNQTTISTTNDLAVAVTYEAGAWDSYATIASDGSIAVGRGVSWIGEGQILNAYTLAAPTILGSVNPDSGNIVITGTGIAGDWMTVTDDNGALIGTAQVAGNGSWVLTPPAGFTWSGTHSVSAQEFDLAGDTSKIVTVQTSDLFLSAGNAQLENLEIGIAGVLAPVNGISTTTLSSTELSALLQGCQGATRFAAGTEAIMLTDGTLSVGPDTNEAFLGRLYEGLFGRAPDENGVSYWDSILSSCGKVAVAQSFLNSTELQTAHAGQDDTSFVQGLYQGMLGRTADAGGLAFWTQALASGVSRAAMAATFADSPEAKQCWSGVTSNGIFAHVLNAAPVREDYLAGLGREADTAGLAAFTNFLNAGGTIEQLAQQTAASPEFQSLHGQQTNVQYVDDLYQNSFGRQADPAGQSYWVNALQGGTSRADVLAAFVQAPEAQQHLQWALSA